MWLQTKDPVEYVQALLEMRDKYENTISRAFNDDKSFRNTLNQVRGILPGGCCARQHVPSLELLCGPFLECRMHPYIICTCVDVGWREPAVSCATGLLMRWTHRWGQVVLSTAESCVLCAVAAVV